MEKLLFWILVIVSVMAYFWLASPMSGELLGAW